MKYAATALLTGYQRPENLDLIIKRLRSQSVKVEILLMANASIPEHNVELRVSASRNLMCWPRWFLANYASTPFVFTLDDDLIFADDHVVRDCIEFVKANPCAVGISGVVLGTTPGYWEAAHVMAVSEYHRPVDILKGRFIFAPKCMLQDLPLIAPVDLSLDNPRLEDDIMVSSYLHTKILPQFLHERLLELPPNDVALSQQPGHNKSRNDATMKWFTQH